MLTAGLHDAGVEKLKQTVANVHRDLQDEDEGETDPPPPVEDTTQS